ncbi:hypothetical protein [Spirosoma radiotolerans]|uniref:Uncharacterized protein n=1 Tax=Spirosoma radiotolerans TaxID=1379870 RepID=A0A0E3V8H8_9BACT|nr:hypothetical protein [Spirosoma radiotolerans]AKD56321.1 hypothetical protein SD10_16840 [Spirosoma radiotolerans]
MNKMKNKKDKSSAAQLERQNPLTIGTFEQLLGHYKKRVWEVKIAPTLTSHEKLSTLITSEP